jgi:signal transduction histidine kinase
MKSCFFIDENGDNQKEIDRYDLKRIVSIPVEAHGRLYGVLALQNTKKGFKFTKKELDLVYQFLFIAAIALENAFMMEEVERSRQELRLLTNKIVTIQEEERRLLAGDIHDTLAQTLTGISYKIEFCKELFKREPTVLLEELDDLLKTVYGAIDQSREIISSLRPDLIDTIGLVPALIRHTANFEKETGICVEVDFPDKMVLSSKLNICLFRIAQEALMNIYKHSEAESAKMNLKREDSHVILAISDNGKGFDATKSATWIRDQNRLGLISMKERVEAAGGAFSIKTQLGDGCTIEATIPLENERSQNEVN